MTATENRSRTSALSAEQIVREVYRAFTSTDPGVIEKTVRQHFADDCVVYEAESLPWGGEYQGLDNVVAMTLGIADPSAPIDAANLIVDDMIVREAGPAGTSHVVAVVSFPWRGTETIPMKALEWFVVENGKVTEIKVYLWDTAAAIAALGPA